MLRKPFSPLEKLELLLESDPEVIESMTSEEVRVRLEELGIDTEPLVKKVQEMVREWLEKQRKEDKGV